MHWLYFNLSLAFFVFTIFYAVWCFVRGHLLYTRLKAIYDEFSFIVVTAIKVEPGLADDIHLDGTVARVLQQQDVCFEAASRLNAFSVAYFKDRNLEGLLSTHVPECEIPVVKEAIHRLRTDKCNAIEFYIRYCRLSGYVWMLWAFLKGIRLDGFRRDLATLIEVLVQPEVAEQFRLANQRLDLLYRR